MDSGQICSLSTIHCPLTMSFELAFPMIIAGSLILSVFLTKKVRKIAYRHGVVDAPDGGRKMHAMRTALWGGLVTGTVIILASACLLPFLDGSTLRSEQIYGFMVAIGILMFGGAMDDRFNLSPWKQIVFPVLASLAIIASGSGIIQVTNPFGDGVISLVWSQWSFLGDLIRISFPSDLITIIWLLVVTYAMKLLDGLDGLVAGLTIISALLIASLAGSVDFFQPIIALLALAIAGVYIGFLPFNKTGSIFLGEGGSTIAGFSLAVLAVISGSKVATAAVALGIPIIDVFFVIVGRVLRGTSPFKGDRSHLHYRIVEAGVSPRNAVRLIWAAALIFGLFALTLQTRGRLFLLAGIAVFVLLVSWIAYVRSSRRS